MRHLGDALAGLGTGLRDLLRHLLHLRPWHLFDGVRLMHLWDRHRLLDSQPLRNLRDALRDLLDLDARALA